MSLEYVLILGLICIPVMILFVRLTAMLLMLWQISDGIWMLPL